MTHVEDTFVATGVTSITSSTSSISFVMVDR